MSREYQIHSHDEKGLLAIKNGFSWPGFFFSFVWATVKGLYLHAGAIVGAMIALWLAAIFMAEVAMVWSFLAALLIFVVGQKGNAWLAQRAEAGGYRFRGTVVARSPAHAVSVFKRTDGEAAGASTRVSRGLADMLPEGMQPIAAMIQLTWKAAFRYRLFLAVAVLLLGSVVGLPLLIKDDGTARGFTQILLTYTLSLITVLLGFATLWLSCGVLARDIEDCQMQVVAVKPIPRWQIWLGKWIGIVSLNTALLAISGGAVLGLLKYRAGTLPEREQEILASEVFVARGSLQEPKFDYERVVDQAFNAVIRNEDTNGMDFSYVRYMIEQEVKGSQQIVQPGFMRRWEIPVGMAALSMKDDIFHLRFRFYGADTNSLREQVGEWRVGSGENVIRSARLPLAANTFHEVPVNPKYLGADKSMADLLNTNGNLIVEFSNLDDTAISFPIEDGFEVLYREGGFTVNYARGLLIILFWLSLLAALGMAASSYMSFPVACFFSLGMLILALSSGTIANTVAEGTVLGKNHETGKPVSQLFDTTLLPVFKGLLGVITLVEGFSPVDSLSTGRSITWFGVARAFFQIVLFLGGLLSLAGMWLFSRRELATAQGNQ